MISRVSGVDILTDASISSIYANTLLGSISHGTRIPVTSSPPSGRNSLFDYDKIDWARFKFTPGEKLRRQSDAGPFRAVRRSCSET